jgi:ribosomal protein S18 acetylase RimI-like enzyme
MTLTIRFAAADDYRPLEKLVIEAFEPITWQKKLDERIGPLNGRHWRARWQARLAHIFATQIVLVGECDGQLAAMASATIDQPAALGFIDVLAVASRFQGRGLGRQMLRGTIEHLKQAGCNYVNLDCLCNNDAGNALYSSEGFEEVARHIRWFRKI